MLHKRKKRNAKRKPKFKGKKAKSGKAGVRQKPQQAGGGGADEILIPAVPGLFKWKKELI